MAFVTIKERRVPESSIMGFRPVYESENNKPYLQVYLHGRMELILFDSNDSLIEEYERLRSSVSGLVNVNDWEIKRSVVKEYKPVKNETAGLYYILVKTSRFSQMKIIFKSEEEMVTHLSLLDQLFEVK